MLPTYRSIIYSVLFRYGEATPNFENVDEGSCICGLNLDILNKLESIVQFGSQQTCSASSLGNHNDLLETGPESAQTEKPQNEPNKWIESKPGSSVNSTPLDQSNLINNMNVVESSFESSSSSSPTAMGKSDPKNEPPIKTDGSERDMLSLVAYLTAEVQKLKVQLEASGKPVQNGVIEGGNSNLQILSNLDDSPSKRIPVDAGFLAGLPASPVDSHNEALMKLNQSSKIDPQEMADALQVTVPNVVSNIFSNINNIITQTGSHNQDSDKRDDPGKLTSIDGSSIDIKSNSSAQISAEGEKLFIQWIEHQLDSLHLTVTTASYIRKNAVSLFRRIAQQYVERMERMGGRVEDNVEKATQIALNNTQHLISFLLKNYLNFSGGLMQIIGEQVSRVGKQLDSTGTTISSYSLNPLTIVTSVLDSLPNPSDYSRYFRAFGKQLTGAESTSDEQQETNSTPETQDKQSGLIRKTVGALGKSLTSWVG